MWGEARSILNGALGDFRRSWKFLVLTDLAYRLIAFALLAPAMGLLLHWLRSNAESGVVADTDIARFLLTTKSGVATLGLGGAPPPSAPVSPGREGRIADGEGRARIRGDPGAERAAPVRSDGGSRPPRRSAVPDRRGGSLLEIPAALRHLQ